MVIVRRRRGRDRRFPRVPPSPTHPCDVHHSALRTRQVPAAGGRAGDGHQGHCRGGGEAEGPAAVKGRRDAVVDVLGRPAPPGAICVVPGGQRLGERHGALGGRRPMPRRVPLERGQSVTRRRLRNAGLGAAVRCGLRCGSFHVCEGRSSQSAHTSHGSAPVDNTPGRSGCFTPFSATARGSRAQIQAQVQAQVQAPMRGRRQRGNAKAAVPREERRPPSANQANQG
jgi:hypothetical protein